MTAFDELLRNPEVKCDINPPASPESVQAFESGLAEQDRVKGFVLPPSYRAFLLRYDGGSIVDDVAGSYPTFLSVQEYEKPWNSLMAYNAADSVLMNHEIETYFPFEPLVMIAMDEGSSFWALDQGQRRGDGEMPVRYCDHESGAVYAQAEDFSAFILALADRLLEYRGLENPIVKGRFW